MPNSDAPGDLRIRSLLGPAFMSSDPSARLIRSLNLSSRPSAVMGGLSLLLGLKVLSLLVSTYLLIGLLTLASLDSGSTSRPSLVALWQDASQSSNPIRRGLASVSRSWVEWIPASFDTVGSLLLLLGSGLLSVLVVAGILVVRGGQYAELMSQVSQVLRRRIHRQAYRLGRTSLSGTGPDDVADLFSIDVEEVRQTIRHDWPLSLLHWTLTVGLVICVVVSANDLAVPVALICLMVLIGLWYRWQERRDGARLDRSGLEAARQLALLRGDLEMLRTVRVFSAEEVERKRFDQHLGAHDRADRQQVRHRHAANPALVLIGGLAAILLAGLIATPILGGAASLASQVALIVSLAMLVGPVSQLRRGRQAKAIAESSAERITRFLDLEPDLLQDVRARFLHPLRQQISLENVSLSDSSDRLLINEVSFTIPAGSRTVILGLDHDTKLALLCLIPRLIDPDSGSVRIDGIDLKEATIESIRDQIAAVFLDNLLLSDTVAANIRLGQPTAELPQIVEAAKFAHVHHAIQRLEAGYDTVIGPRGVELPQGYPFLIALARAYLSDSSVILIEEPRGVLDSQFKDYLDDVVEKLKINRTLIFVPHRLSTIRNADQVIVLNEGRVEAVGTPGDLQASNRLFRQLQVLETNPFTAGELEHAS